MLMETFKTKQTFWVGVEKGHDENGPELGVTIHVARLVTTRGLNTSWRSVCKLMGEYRSLLRLLPSLRGIRALRRGER